MDELKVVGKRFPNVDSVQKATGQAQYTDDIILPGMLYGKILRSPYPHAKILNINTSKAKRLFGVRAVITGNDTLGAKYGWVLDWPQSIDEPGLALDKVRYIGDEVAATAAIDEEIASEALDLIEVEYEPLPAVFDPEEAMGPEAPKIHDAERNVCLPVLLNFGNVDEALKECTHVREDRFITQKKSHCSIEPRAALSSFDSTGKLTHWATLQSVYFFRKHLAKLLGVPESQVRVIKPFVGGGFGGKHEMLSVDFCAALLSKKAGKPVKIAHTRDEDLTAARFKHPMIIYMKTGVKRDGTIHALYGKVIADTGAYAAVGPVVTHMTGAFMTLIYKLPNVRYEGYCVYTNKSIPTCHRGFGNQQIRFAAEQHLDMLAEELGMDPADLRLRNAVEPGWITPNRYIITSCGFKETIEEAVKRSGWRMKRGERKNQQGIGMGCVGYVCGAKALVPHDSSSAFIKFDEDGTVTIISGVSDIGQGSNTLLAQIVAEELGVALEDVRVSMPDTEITPIDLGTFGSRVTIIGGNAVKNAAKDAKQQLLEAAAEKLEAHVEDLAVGDRRVYVKGSPEKGMTIAEAVLASQWSRKGKPILGRGYYNPEFTEVPDPTTGIGNISPSYSFGTMTAEVKIEPETGLIKVLKVTAAEDVGFAINPMACEGQVEGSVVGAAGYVLFEEFFEDKGLMLNTSLRDYMIPTSLDVPEIETILIETKDPEGPFGAKGMSEAPEVPPVAAIANALYDATGIRLRSLPLTPEKVLEALKSFYSPISSNR